MNSNSGSRLVVERIFRFFVFAVVLSGLSVVGAGSGYATENPANDSTSKISQACSALIGQELGLLQSVDQRSQILAERKSLSELLETGPESLIHKHPWLIMNSAQRALHMIYDSGVREVPDRSVGFGTRKRYAFFSDGIDLTNGNFIVGHLPGIARIVSFIEATADGQPGKDHVPILIGPPATGKSHILTMFQGALRNGTSSRPEYFAYSFEWVNLSPIKTLKGRLPNVATQADSAEPFSDPINDSPIALLPELLQAKVLEAHAQRVRELVGRDPKPKTQLNPQSDFIRQAILSHYSEKLNRPLSVAEEVKFLSEHVRLKRVILGNQTNSPYLANQGKEPNLARLFGSNNPMVKATFGDDPFAVHYGVLARANSGVTFLDEIMKNEPSLLGQFLNLFSSHIVEVAPGVQVPVDVFYIAASNTKERDDLRAKDPQNPLLSRNLDISWPYVFYPDEVGRVLVMEIQGLKARELGQGSTNEDSAYKLVSRKDVFKLYPEPHPFEAIVTPHGRYALKIGASVGKEVFISPHSLEFIANVVALTRLNFDREKVRHGEKYPLVRSNDSIFSNPVVRLRVLLGQKDVTEAQLEDLHRISLASGEGNFGMDHRDFERWFTAAIAEAQASSRGHTLTPILLYEVLQRQVLEDKIFAGNKAMQDRLSIFALQVFSEFVAPAMKEDLNLAFARSEGREVIDTVYDEVIQELAALGHDNGAEVYIAQPSNERRRIDKERLKKITEIYQKLQGRALSASEIATWTMFTHRQADPARTKQRHQGLSKAISAYQSEVVLAKEKTNFKRLLDVADNTVNDAKTRERALASELITILQDELGYNLVAAKSAIEVLATLEANRSQSSGAR